MVFDFMNVLEGVIESAEPGTVSEEFLQKLQFFFPDTLILAALDLIDRECVIRFTSPTSKTHLQVKGSTASYSVFLNLLPGSSSYPNFFCTCPAHAFSVLLSETHVMCKHVLASRLAEKIDKVVTRNIGFEDWAHLISNHGDTQMH